MIALALLVGLPARVLANENPAIWRLAVGGVQNLWLTDGRHGHYEDCRTHACNDEDFRRGNLDNSLGYRFAAERLRPLSDRWALLWGVQASLLGTEYNRSQRGFGIVSVEGLAGIDCRAGRWHLLAKAGAGPAVTTSSPPAARSCAASPATSAAGTSSPRARLRTIVSAASREPWTGGSGAP